MHQRLRTDLAQGRAPVTQDLLFRLAQAMTIDIDELQRPLTAKEDRAWSFYRRAARDNLVVWHNARAAWTTSGLSLRDAATIIGCRHQTLAHALRHPTSRTLTFEAAQALIRTLRLEIEPEDWLPERTRCDAALHR
jgi:hypothetical protein